ncbi:MAG: M14 family metallopeptidase [Planctomycetota bacterium]|jgi:hypothetical protein
MLIGLLATVWPVLLPSASDLLTVAESSDYRATATYGEVMSLAEALDARSDRVRVVEMGRTAEDRAIPLLVVADPPVATPEAARASGKVVLLAYGNIHAGEVCGKEALLRLAREAALDPASVPLSDVVLLLCPILNADGNQPMDPRHRPGQVGPAEGMGRRPNAQGLDLNRDFVKLESPEIRALVRVLTEWDPHLTIDTHTTNGSHHRYTLTYDSPLNPSGHPAPIELVRDRLLPTVSERLRDRTGYDTFFYGNFDRDHAVWATYSAMPRFGGPYQGLRGQMAVLSEAYAYASYRDRVLCTHAFVREIARYAAEHRPEILRVHERARRETTEAGRNPRPDDVVGLRHRLAAWPAPVVVRGYVETTDERGRRRPTDEPRDYTVVHLGRFEPTVSVRRPAAYVLEAGLDGVVDTLRAHGIEVEPFAGPARVETYTVTRIERAERPFQGHRLVRLEVDAAPAGASFGAGCHLVRTAQPLGTLAVSLLEPRAEDGLAAWNFLDGVIAEGDAYPVHRVASPADLTTPRAP